MNPKIIAKGILNLLCKRYMGPFWIRRRWLNRTQWLDKEKLEQLQLNLLKRTVRHCYRTVAYYKKIMDEYGIGMDTIKTLSDIKSFPILTKKEVLEAGDSIISSNYHKRILRTARTGGSTGTPLIVYRNWISIGNEHAFVQRQWDWAGIGVSDRCAYLMSRVVAKHGRQNHRLYAYDPFMKDLILSTHHLSIKTVKHFADAIRKYRVKAIVGYPSAISFLAKSCLNLGIELNLKAALTTSEILTPTMCQNITKAFRCKVFDFYGSAERVCYIHNCQYGNYHLIPEYGYTELIPLNGSDKKFYKVVSTGFWNSAMPLIRYDTGDIVTKTKRTCPCGRQFEVIDSIDGRQGDIIKTPSGRQLGVTLIIQILYVICGTKHILESQIVQDGLDHLTIKYVPDRKFETKDLNDFRNLLSKSLPDELKFDFRSVSTIEKTGNGKVRPLVSLINA